MDDLLTGFVLGDYEIEDRIGKGGMGVVYRARQISLDRPVALKVLPPELCVDTEYVDRFLREARAAAHLNHPSITQIFDAGVSENIYFFIMEFVDGKNLGQIVRERGRLDERETLDWMRQTAIGLSFAHSKGIVHRDVKPENLMLTSRGSVKIGDLGLAKWKPNEFDASLTSSGVTMGTPYYISPEQIRGAKDIDGRADIYSLGMTIYHLLNGKPAFSEGSPPEIMAQHLSEEMPPLEASNPHLSRKTIDLVIAMTAKRRENRVQQMAEVADTLAIMLGQPPARTPTRGIRTSNAPGAQASDPSLLVRIRKTGIAGLLAAIIGMLIALVILLVWKSSQQSQKPQPQPSAPVENTVTSSENPKPSANGATPQPTTPTPAVIAKPPSRPRRPQPVVPPPQPSHTAIKPGSEPTPPVESRPPTETVFTPIQTETAQPEPPTETPSTDLAGPPDGPPGPDEPPPVETSPKTVAPAPIKPLRPPQERIIERQFGSDLIRETVITSRTDSTVGTSRFGSGSFRGPGGRDRDPYVTASQLLELTVGNENNEFKALIRPDFGPQISERYQKLAQKLSQCTSAVLSITPGSSTSQNVEIEVYRINKAWGQSDLPRFETENTGGSYGRGNYEGDSRLYQSRELVEARRKETNWEWASVKGQIKWWRPGAAGRGEDYITPALASIDDPARVSFKITSESLQRPIRLNILSDLRAWADEMLRQQKLIPHHGWIIQLARGRGEVRFHSTKTSPENAPKLILLLKETIPAEAPPE